MRRAGRTPLVVDLPPGRRDAPGPPRRAPRRSRPTPDVGLVLRRGRSDRRRGAVRARVGRRARGARAGRSDVRSRRRSCPIWPSSNPLRCSAVTIRARPAHARSAGSTRRTDTRRLGLLDPRRPRPGRRLARPADGRRSAGTPASETHRFKTGTTDLDEQARLLRPLSARIDRAGPKPGDFAARPTDAWRGPSSIAPYDALRGGDPDLARHCLRHAVALSPRVLGTIARRPEALRPDGRPHRRSRGRGSLGSHGMSDLEQVGDRAAEAGEDVPAVEDIPALQSIAVLSDR